MNVSRFVSTGSFWIRYCNGQKK